MFANEFSLMGDARSVARNVATQDFDQLGDTFAAHRALVARSSLGFGTLGLERALTERTLTLADVVIANYRMALPTVREAQWKVGARCAETRAADRLRRPTRLRAALHYCEGHLHRINGEALKMRREEADAQRELTDAVASFRQAAETAHPTGPIRSSAWLACSSSGWRTSTAAPTPWNRRRSAATR